jgi:uncharacterized integral membrane protein
MADQRNERRPAAQTKEGLGAKQWLMVACAVLLVLFFVLNLQEVKVHLLVTTVKMPLVIALVIAAALGLVLGWAVPRLRRDPRKPD